MDIVSKSTGDSWSAAEQNQITNELENALSSTGQTPSAGDLFQVGKAMVDYSSHGNFYTDSGAASAYVLTVGSPKQSPTAYVAGFRARFIVGNTNTGASTVNIGALGVKAIKRVGGTATLAGDMTTGDSVEIEYDGTDFILLYSSSDKTKVDQGLTFNIIKGSNPGLITITTSLLSIFTLDLGTVVAGDIFRVDSFLNGSKGGTSGSVRMEIKKTAGSTSVIETYNNEEGIFFEITVGVSEVFVFSPSAEITVTTGGTLVLDFAAISVGSSSSVAIDGVQIYTRQVKKQ